MSELEEKESWWDRLRQKRRWVSMDIKTFSERKSFQLSNLNIISIFLSFSLLLIVGTYLIVAYTPIKRLIPGFPDGSEKAQIQKVAQETNQINTKAIEATTRYYQSIATILNDGIPGDTSSYGLDTLEYKDQELELSSSEEDSLLRVQMEEERKFLLESQNGGMGNDNGMGNVFFFTPITGTVSQSFAAEKGHMGVDVVAAENEGIKATLDGTVIFASWTSDAGHVIQIQHSNNLISVYKHNSVLLKEVGEKVEAGEPIAIIGNSGEYTSGPHLHFELWQNGSPVNPQMYINF